MYTVLGGGTFGTYLGLENGALMNGIRAFITNPTEPETNRNEY